MSCIRGFRTWSLDSGLSGKAELTVSPVGVAAPLAFALAISMYGFTLTLYSPLKIGLADIAIGTALLYVLFRRRHANMSSIVVPIAIFAGTHLLSGVMTAWRFAYFDELNFSINFARIAAILVTVALLPEFYQAIGCDRMCWGLLWAFRVNATAILVDLMGWLPEAFSPSAPHMTRPSGFFLEPGWYSASILLFIFCLLYAESVLRRRLLNRIDITLFVLSIVLSAGFRGIVPLPLTILILVAIDMRLRSLRTVIGVSCAVLVLAVASLFFPDSVIGRTVVQVQERTGRIVSTVISRVEVLDSGTGAAEEPKPDRQPVDTTSNLRLDATFGFIKTMISERLFWGVGLGGNVINGYVFFSGASASSHFFSEELNKHLAIKIARGGANGIATASSFDNVLIGGGPLTLLAYLLIAGWLVLNPDTRMFGVFFSLFCFSWEAIYQPFVWAIVALAVALGQRLGEHSDASKGFGRGLRKAWRISLSVAARKT